jgi:hypothetical protein
MLIVAPVKYLERARFGQKLSLKHLPDMPLLVSDDLHARITQRFMVQFTLWGQLEDTQLLLVGTFSQLRAGIYSLDEACFVNVNAGWIPFETVHEHQLLRALAERRYSKGLRYNMPRSKPLASAVLQDTETPAALYVVEADADDKERQALDTLTQASDMATWYWDCRSGGMPQLPAVRGAMGAPSRPGVDNEEVLFPLVDRAGIDGVA